MLNKALMDFMNMKPRTEGRKMAVFANIMRTTKDGREYSIIIFRREGNFTEDAIFEDCDNDDLFAIYDYCDYIMLDTFFPQKKVLKRKFAGFEEKREHIDKLEEKVYALLFDRNGKPSTYAEIEGYSFVFSNIYVLIEKKYKHRHVLNIKLNKNKNDPSYLAFLENYLRDYDFHDWLDNELYKLMVEEKK